jgi:hypothetical protein
MRKSILSYVLIYFRVREQTKTEIEVFLKNPKKVVVHVTKEKTPVPPRSDFEVAISVKNHTHKTIRVLGFIDKVIKII